MMEQKNNQIKHITEYIEAVLPFTGPIFKRFPWFSQFVNFSVVGVINMGLSYLVYAVLIYLHVHHQIANLAAFWISVMNGYILNRFWVFKKHAVQRSPAQTLRYFLTYGFNMLLGIALMYLYVDILHLNKYIVPFISLPITIPLNYCINRFWVFRRRKEQA